ncbi:MAG: NHL repeat-containing protein, partial [Candidatus Cybelea sp.]
MFKCLAIQLGAFSFLAALAGCAAAPSQLTVPTLARPDAPNVGGRAGTKIVLVGTGWKAPWDVAVDSKGSVYVGDISLNAVKKVSPPFRGGTHGKIRDLGQFGKPESLAVDSKGNVYVFEAYGHDEILQVTPSGVKNLVANYLDTDEGGLAADSHENVYFASGALYELRHKAAGGWDAPRQIGPKFSYAYDVALDPAGNLYVAEGRAVEELTPSGKVVMVGSGFKAPSGVAVDRTCKSSCAVYVADNERSWIWKVSPPFDGSTHGKITKIGYGFSGPISVAALGTDV